MTPRILIVAGSDSGGGAGIQADIKTVTMLRGHAMTAITAITAQNTLGVQAVMPITADMVIAQMRSVIDDIGVDAIKIGMIGSAETAHAVADLLETLDVPVVFDPVMVATSGSVLADAATIAAFERLMQRATLVTPNVPELFSLSSVRASTSSARTEERMEAARSLATRTGTAIFAKGGDADGEELTDILVRPDGSTQPWTAPRIASTSTHGTGCTLASAIATELGRGVSLPAAIATARRFVRLAMHDAPGLGQGTGPMGHQQVRLDTGPGPRLDQVTLPGDAASVGFYAALGLRQIVATDHGYARFEARGGATLSIEAGAAPTVFLECDDLDATLAALATKGITATPPVDQPWRWREARLTDPAGNALCLFEAGEDRRYPPWRLP